MCVELCWIDGSPQPVPPAASRSLVPKGKSMFHDMMADPSLLVMIATVLAALSGVPGLVLRYPPLGQRLAAGTACLAALLALPSLAYMLLTGARARYLLELNLPFGACELALDPLSLFFLIPIFLVFAAGACYATGYWPARSHRHTEPSVTFFYGLLSAAMAMVVLSRNGALFLISWEVMALSGYFLLVTEHEEAEVRSAGVVYLVASHLGAAFLLFLFAQLKLATGSFLFPATGTLAVSSSLIFVAALVGFGSKAGIMPLHVWLPSAHANAPSHVSALLSGVMLKMGIYGILRVVSFFPEKPLWWGALLLVAGLTSALMGICVASAQKDVKRLLAYSSIENLGIVAAGVGMALIGQSVNSPRLVWLGLAGALFHVLNHALFKPLMFFAAGSLIHATGTRDLDRMGGLAKRLPASSLLTLAGSIAICGLPPFNGFVSELLLYLGFFGEAVDAPEPYVALGAPVLALVGGVALLSFVKLFGSAFLGAPRSAEAAAGHESPPSMLAPMALLALLCLAGGLFPQGFLALVTPVLGSVFPQAKGYGGLSFNPLWLTALGGALIVTAALLFFALKERARGVCEERGPTWGCGYLRPAPRMQYTASSFGVFFGSLAAPLIRTRIKVAALAGLAPAPVRLSYQPEETILYRVIVPVLEVAGICFSWLRRLQHGEMQFYILYIFATLLLLMLWVR